MVGEILLFALTHAVRLVTNMSMESGHFFTDAGTIVAINDNRDLPSGTIIRRKTTAGACRNKRSNWSYSWGFTGTAHANEHVLHFLFVGMGRFTS